jgi:hypothetical protein
MDAFMGSDTFSARFPVVFKEELSNTDTVDDDMLFMRILVMALDLLVSEDCIARFPVVFEEET